MIHEFVVSDRPVAMVTLFDNVNLPHLPMIAVAVGSSILYYKDFSLLSQFEIPLIEFSKEESDIWAELLKITNTHFNSNEDATESSQDLDQKGLPEQLDKLFNLREEKKVHLSYMSARLMAIDNT